MPSTDEVSGSTASGARNRGGRRRPRSAGEAPNGGHGDRPRWLYCDRDQPADRDRLVQEHTPERGIRDEHLRWTFGSLVVAGHIWSASLRNHVAAVNQVIEAIASAVDPAD